jgi:hypothetical protein
VNSEDYRKLARHYDAVAAWTSLTEHEREMRHMAEHWRQVAERTSLKENQGLAADRFRGRAAECREEAARSVEVRRRMWQRFAAVWDHLAVQYTDSAGIWESVPPRDLRKR